MSARAVLFLLPFFYTSVFGPEDASACPPRRETLRELVDRADAIVVGKVLATDERGIVIGADRILDDDPRLGTRIDLRGVVAREGATVMVCLRYDRARDAWATTARQRIQTIEDDARGAALEARVRECVEVRKIPSPAARRDATRAWLIRCLEDPATRDDAARDLLEPGDGADLGRITAGERGRIVEALLASEGEPWNLLALAARTGDRRVAAWVREALEKQAAGADVTYARPLMEAAAEALDWGAGRALAERWFEVAAEERPWLLDVFLTKLAAQLRIG